MFFMIFIGVEARSLCAVVTQSLTLWHLTVGFFHYNFCDEVARSLCAVVTQFQSSYPWADGRYPWLCEFGHAG
jgi:hypothetical protein